MKRPYIKPTMDALPVSLEQALAKSFDYTPRYGNWESDDYLSQTGGSSGGSGGNVGWRGGNDDGGIDGDDMFAKGFNFGDGWDDLGW